MTPSKLDQIHHVYLLSRMRWCRPGADRGLQCILWGAFRLASHHVTAAQATDQAGPVGKLTFLELSRVFTADFPGLEPTLAKGHF